MAILFEGFEYLAEENPAQYAELLNAFQQISSKIELEAQYAENLAKYSDYLSQYADYQVLPNGQVGHTFINTGTRIAGEYLGPVSSSTETALELATEAYDYEVIGANGQILYRSNMGAMETAVGSNSYQATSLLSLDVGVVGAAVAPLAGLALGFNLYQNNPEFWTKLSQKLLPFCYPGTTEIPGWLDIVESALEPGTYETRAVIDKSIVDAVIQWLQEEGYGIGDGKTSEYHTRAPQPIQVLRSFSFTVNNAYGSARYKTIYYFSKEGCVVTPTTQNPDNTSLRIFFASNTQVTFDYYVDYYDSGSFTRRDTHSIPLNREITIDGKTAFGNVSYIAISAGTVAPDAPLQDYDSTGNELQTYWTMLYGECAGNPEGTSEWQGYEPSLGRYSKPIVYMEEDPENPGHFIPVSRDGIGICLPDDSTREGDIDQSTKPANWPEDVDWPLEIEFPWPKPDGYEGEWPETMPWPLPDEKPIWWPDGVPYPKNMPSPVQTPDPEEEPDPNKNSDNKKSGRYIDTSAPETKIDPAEEPEPDPDGDPVIPDPPVVAVVPIDPPGPPGTVDPPVDGGETPVPVTPIIDLPFTPAAPVNDGLITVYHPTDAQLKAFSQWLWVTYADPSIDKLWNNPFDGVIGLMELYCTPTDVGVKSIRSGFLDSGVQSQTISRYTEIDCGSIFIPEYYRNYLDYSPYSRAHIYLPFIGIVELNVDDVVGHGINVTYKIDEYNGACIAIITCAKHHEIDGDDVDYSAITYQYSGNCAVELPLAGGTQASIRAGLIQAAAYGLSSVIGGVISGVSGNIGGAISQIGYGAANAIGSVVSAKSSVQHSGSFGSSYGALGLKTPFIVISRPRQIRVINYPKIYGYPAHAGVTIGSCTGYLRAREVHVLSATATDEEKKRIEELLKEGVLVTE